MLSTVGGGRGNSASGNLSIVDGGDANTASGIYSTVGGGRGNSASGNLSIVDGGDAHIASGAYSTVGGGLEHNASGFASTVGGGKGNIASGVFSTVVGGQFNTASGDYSVAMGNKAKALGYGSFAFGDSYVFDFPTESNDEFAVRATGGVRLVTAIDAATGVPTRTVKINANGELDFGSQVRQMLNLWGPATFGVGVQVGTLYGRSNTNFAWFRGGVHADGMNDAGSGGSVLATLQEGASATTVTGTFRALAFTATSDRDQKTDMAPTDGADILERLVSMPISTWAYKVERDAGFRHIGPTAQDFRERFGVGYDDKSIATVDADGVALAAIQGLNAKLEAAIAERDARIDVQARGIESAIAERDARIDAQAREIAQQRSEISELMRAVEVLLTRTSPEGRTAAR